MKTFTSGKKSGKQFLDVDSKRVDGSFNKKVSSKQNFELENDSEHDTPTAPSTKKRVFNIAADDEDYSLKIPKAKGKKGKRKTSKGGNSRSNKKNKSN